MGPLRKRITIRTQADIFTFVVIYLLFCGCTCRDEISINYLPSSAITVLWEMYRLTEGIQIFNTSRLTQPNGCSTSFSTPPFWVLQRLRRFSNSSDYRSLRIFSYFLLAEHEKSSENSKVFLFSYCS